MRPSSSINYYAMPFTGYSTSKTCHRLLTSSRHVTLRCRLVSLGCHLVTGHLKVITYFHHLVWVLLIFFVLGCSDVSCMDTQFTCDSYKCIPEDYRCDGEEDCNDGTDEGGCPRNCEADQFYCYEDEKCIERNLVCNGQKDCSNGDDESKCPTQLTSRCEKKEFTCGDGSCVPSDFVCDGTRDCLDGSDENHGNCTVKCTSKERACVKGQKCIPTPFWCDGDIDCEDGSDEKGCKIVVIDPKKFYKSIQ